VAGASPRFHHGTDDEALRFYSAGTVLEHHGDIVGVRQPAVRPTLDQRQPWHHDDPGVVRVPGQAESVFQTPASATTLAMDFLIQRTESRAQAATQRKLDEILELESSHRGLT
jgi:hypothetical protein